MSVLCIDVDGCLADFTSSYAALLEEVHGSSLLPEGWRRSPDFPPVWQWERFYGYPAEVEKAVWQTHITGKNNFWLRLGTLPHARETLMVLNKRAKMGDEVYFLTHRMGQKAKYQTEQWLYENCMDYPTVILGGDKVPFLRSLGATFFIDDKPETLVEVSRVAQEEKWPLSLYVRGTPYNRTVRVGTRVDSVKDALVEAGLWLTS